VGTFSKGEESRYAREMGYGGRHPVTWTGWVFTEMGACWHWGLYSIRRIWNAPVGTRMGMRPDDGGGGRKRNHGLAAKRAANRKRFMSFWRKI